MDLNKIQVLWRQSDTMALYGIPYNMREGQSPRDIFMAEWPGILQPGERKATPRKHSGQVPSDWIYLGNPGWWGSISRDDQAKIQKFLEFFKAKDLIPGGPNEFCELHEERVVWLKESGSKMTVLEKILYLRYTKGLGLVAANYALINGRNKCDGPWEDDSI